LRVIRKLLRSRRQATNDRSREYWEEGAKKNVYNVICDGITTAKKFYEKDSSILFFEPINLKDKVVLDLCCGIGRIACHLPSSVNYIGVDFSTTMIRKAKERYKDCPNIRFVLNGGHTLEMLKDDTFDVCVCEYAFQHMNKNTTKQYIQEVYRVLKLNGVFRAQVPRMCFYKDDAYAFQEKETLKLFQSFRATRILWRYPHTHAYFLVEAKK